MPHPGTLAAQGYALVRWHPRYPLSGLFVKPKRAAGPLIPASDPARDRLPGPVIVTIRYSRPLTTLTRAERARLVTLLTAYAGDVEKGGAMGERVVRFALAGP